MAKRVELRTQAREAWEWLYGKVLRCVDSVATRSPLMLKSISGWRHHRLSRDETIETIELISVRGTGVQIVLTHLVATNTLVVTATAKAAPYRDLRAGVAQGPVVDLSSTVWAAVDSLREQLVNLDSTHVNDINSVLRVVRSTERAALSNARKSFSV